MLLLNDTKVYPETDQNLQCLVMKLYSLLTANIVVFTNWKSGLMVEREGQGVAKITAVLPLGFMNLHNKFENIQASHSQTESAGPDADTVAVEANP